MSDIIKQLSEAMDQDAIQRTAGSETKKGYDTTGFGYQYCVDRFNDILGEDWGYEWHILKDLDGAYQSGMPYHDVTVMVSIWVKDKNNARSCAGGHTARTFADALKGAITNGFKKTAAFWGVGREAYAGEIDDDNVPLPESHDQRSPKPGGGSYSNRYDVKTDIIDKLKLIQTDDKLAEAERYIESKMSSLSEKQATWVNDELEKAQSRIRGKQ